MRALPLCLALPLLFALAAPVLSAPAEFTRQDSLTTALQKIPAGKSIRLALLDPAGTRLEGPFQRFVADTLYLSDDRVGDRALPADSLRTVWVRGNASGAGAAVLGLGVAVVALIGFGELSSGVGFGSSGDSGESAFLYAAGAGFAGALIGYGIGSLIETWDQKYPKQKKAGPSRQ